MWPCPYSFCSARKIQSIRNASDQPNFHHFQKYVSHCGNAVWFKTCSGFMEIIWLWTKGSANPSDSFLHSVTTLLFWLYKSCTVEEVECSTLCLHNTLLTVRQKYHSRVLSFSVIARNNPRTLFFFSSRLVEEEKKYFEQTPLSLGSLLIPWV